MRYRPGLLDTTDVDAALDREAYLSRQLVRALAQNGARYAQGYQTALEDLGADVTITDGIPLAVS